MAALTLVVVAPAASAATATPAAPPTKSYDVEFLEMMIDHHAMAVHMSEMCLFTVVHNDLRNLCASIASTQEVEVHKMQNWLHKWYGIDHEPTVDMDDPMMQELMMSSGKKFEKIYLEMMIVHHAMAVQDAVVCLKEATHSQLRALCQSIVSSQTREIVLMQTWLCRWYGECDFTNPLEIDTSGMHM